MKLSDEMDLGVSKPALPPVEHEVVYGGLFWIRQEFRNATKLRVTVCAEIRSRSDTHYRKLQFESKAAAACALHLTPIKVVLSRAGGAAPAPYGLSYPERP